MKFSIEREALQKGLGAVASAIPTRTTLPVLSKILMKAEDGLHQDVGENKVEADMAADARFRSRIRQLQDELFRR